LKIEGTPKEIAALVFELQERRETSPLYEELEKWWLEERVKWIKDLGF